MGITRFYDKVTPSKSKKEIDEDFDLIEELYNQLKEDVKEHHIELVHTPIEEAFKCRLQIILFQNKYRAFYLLKGMITELNANNLPAVIPLVRTFFELMVQLGYLCLEIVNSDDLKYLMNEPMYKVYLGNKNEKAGKLAIGKVETINILTMIQHVDKYINSVGENKSDDKEIIMNTYSDMSNQSHPNYGSNMLYSSIDEEGTFKTLDDIGESMETVKALAYHFYMIPLLTGVAMYNLFMGKILDDVKVK